MTYTAHDTEALTQRIDSELAEVVAAVRKADPHLRSLILTGGFARGEGMVRGGVPQNDYDFVAVRGVGRPREAYSAVRRRLERRLGLHVDLACVSAWRLRWAPSSVFWYETALRGRVLWGDDVLPNIPIRGTADIDPAEGLRLITNRAAGLLLATETVDAHAVRIQASKAILAAFDVHLLAAGHFAPSQTERWHLFQQLLAADTAPLELHNDAPLFTWAFRFKTEPAAATEKDPESLWMDARRVVLEALPVALRHAGFSSLEKYGRSDGLLDHVVYNLRVHGAKGAKRFIRSPTGKVRVATLRLLEATPERQVNGARAEDCLSGMARVDATPLRTLEALRGATLQ